MSHKSKSAMINSNASYKGGKTKCEGSRDEGMEGKELDNRELGENEENEGCHNQM